MNTTTHITTQKTIHMNIALLEFLGYENKKGEVWTHPNLSGVLPCGRKLWASEARFHESLEWLGVAIAKIVRDPNVGHVSQYTESSGGDVRYEVGMIVYEDPGKKLQWDSDVYRMEFKIKNDPCKGLFLLCYRYVVDVFKHY